MFAFHGRAIYWNSFKHSSGKKEKEKKKKVKKRLRSEESIKTSHDDQRSKLSGEIKFRKNTFHARSFDCQDVALMQIPRFAR